MERDYSNYECMIDDGMIWIQTPMDKDYNSVSPVFPTQEQLAQAFSQCTDFITRYRKYIYKDAEWINDKFGNKTDTDLLKEFRQEINDVDYDELLDIMFDYQTLVVATNSDTEIFNEVKNDAIPNTKDDIENDKLFNDSSIDIIDRNCKDTYYYVKDSEVLLGNVVVKQQLSVDEQQKYDELTQKIEKNLNTKDYQKYFDERQLIIWLACVRLARKLVIDYKE